MNKIPSVMRAVSIDEFGGPEKLALRMVPVPGLEPDEVLVQVDVAGVGVWDPFEREGGFARFMPAPPAFPYVLGSEGAGTIAAVGAKVTRLREGDRVYAIGFLNPKGGLYAECAVLKEGWVWPIPAHLSVEQAAVIGGVGTTALRGLDDVLQLRRDETVLILGAGGGIGHLAVQLAKRKGARVVAIGSGDDSVSLAQSLGADLAVNGRSSGWDQSVRTFAPDGVDVALLTAGGAAAEGSLSLIRPGGRAAVPNGVEPMPTARAGVELKVFDADPDPELLERLTRITEQERLNVHVAKTFPFAQVADAQRALDEHYLGKIALRIT